MDPKSSADPKLRAPAAVRAVTPGPGMGYLAVVLGPEPAGVQVRLRLARGVLTCVIPPGLLPAVLGDPAVEAVQVSGLVRMAT